MDKKYTRIAYVTIETCTHLAWDNKGNPSWQHTATYNVYGKNNKRCHRFIVASEERKRLERILEKHHTAIY